MANTKEGGRKLSATLRKKYGDDYWKEMGRRGGLKKGIAKGFAVTGKAREAGAKGVRTSRRGPSKDA